MLTVGHVLQWCDLTPDTVKSKRGYEFLTYLEDLATGINRMYIVPIIMHGWIIFWGLQDRYTRTL